MFEKDSFQRLAVGAFIVTSLTTYTSTAASKDDVFSLKETNKMQPCYWLSREIPAEGLCGEKMSPDVKVLIQEAEKGNGIAAMRLGQLFSTGNWGIEQDLDKAIQWFKKAAELGDRYSQLRLAQAYEFGRMGVQVDVQSAIRFYTMATENGIYPDLEERIENLKTLLPSKK